MIDTQFLRNIVVRIKFELFRFKVSIVFPRQGGFLFFRSSINVYTDDKITSISRL